MGRYAEKGLGALKWERAVASIDTIEDGPSVEVFYDGLCPVCRQEIRLLQRLDQQRSLRAIDITGPDFDAAQYGLKLSDFVSRMYVRDQEGVMHEGLDSFPIMWGAVGPSWVWGWTRTPGVRQLALVGYAIFRRVRPRISGFKPCLADGSCRRPSGRSSQ